MYTPQQTAKPLSSYDSYIQQSLAAREALRVKPHAHTPKNEPLPDTAGLEEGTIHITVPIQADNEVLYLVIKVVGMPEIYTRNISCRAFATAISAINSFVSPSQSALFTTIITGILCRGGPF